MSFWQNFTAAFHTLFANLFEQPDWHIYLDIILTTIIVYSLIRLVVRTRSSAVVKGVAILLLFTWLSDILRLNVVNWLVRQVLNTGVVVIVILFQPELRRALEKIGRSSFLSSSNVSSKSAKEVSQSVSELVQSMTNMSRKRIGALIVFERKIGLREFADTGVSINADITAPLIENIFEPNTPLHDGATIIRGGRILASACILQLSNDPDIARELGTRHRAAIGVTETTDAVAFVVSEETGVISMAKEGCIERYLDIKTLSNELTQLLSDSLPRRGLFHASAADEPSGEVSDK